MGRSKRLRNISRCDRRRLHGWRVMLKRRGRPSWRYFLDQDGDREASLRAAKKWRDRMLLKLPPPLRISRKDVRNTTGVVGVHLDRSRDKYGRVHLSYRASWPDDASGKTVRRGFSVKKYGEERALELAAKARRGGVRRLMAAKRSELVRELGGTEAQRTRIP